MSFKIVTRNKNTLNNRTPKVFHVNKEEKNKHMELKNRFSIIPNDIMMVIHNVASGNASNLMHVLIGLDDFTLHDDELAKRVGIHPNNLKRNYDKCVELKLLKANGKHYEIDYENITSMYNELMKRFEETGQMTEAPNNQFDNSDTQIDNSSNHCDNESNQLDFSDNQGDGIIDKAIDKLAEKPDDKDNRYSDASASGTPADAGEYNLSELSEDEYRVKIVNRTINHFKDVPEHKIIRLLDSIHNGTYGKGNKPVGYKVLFDVCTAHIKWLYPFATKRGFESFDRLHYVFTSIMEKIELLSSPPDADYIKPDGDYNPWDENVGTWKTSVRPIDNQFDENKLTTDGGIVATNAAQPINEIDDAWEVKEFDESEWDEVKTVGNESSLAEPVGIETETKEETSMSAETEIEAKSDEPPQPTMREIVEMFVANTLLGSDYLSDGIKKVAIDKPMKDFNLSYEQLHALYIEHFAQCVKEKPLTLSNGIYDACFKLFYSKIAS